MDLLLCEVPKSVLLPQLPSTRTQWATFASSQGSGTGPTGAFHDNLQQGATRACVPVLSIPICWFRQNMIHIIWITDVICYINCIVFDKRIQGVITDLHIMYCRSKFELSHTEGWNICCVPFAARCSVRLPADFNSTLRKGKCFHTICIHSFSVCIACIAASHAMPWRFSRP